jgi:hypothetical protein
MATILISMLEVTVLTFDKEVIHPHLDHISLLMMLKVKTE